MRTLLACLALIAPVANAAIVKYEYTGAQYDYYADASSDPMFQFNPWAGVAQDYMTGWFLLDTDLLPGGSNANVTVSHTIDQFAECDEPDECIPLIPDHYFSDGVYEQYPGVQFPSFEAVAMVFQFTTDANGDLAWWHILMSDDEVYDQWITSDGDRRYFPPCGNPFIVNNVCVKSSQAGTWVQTPVPEPGAFALMGAAMLLGIARFRRTRRTGLDSASQSR